MKINIGPSIGRIIISVVLLILYTIVSLITVNVLKEKDIVKTDIKVCLNSDTEETFTEQFDGKREFYKYYNYTKSDSSQADFILTSDINDINTDKEYTTEAYSPLVVCLKNDSNLNNYLKSNTSEGFLTCGDAKKIRNNEDDNITCDFARIIDVVVNGGDWSDLGGEDKKITIYCPPSNTAQGDLFYKFLLVTINGGKYPTNNLKEIEEKAQKFLQTPNVQQTDVLSKTKKLDGNLLGEDIYVMFEKDALSLNNEGRKITIAYPELTVIMQVYLQFNNDSLKDGIMDIFNIYGGFSGRIEDLGNELYYNKYRKLNNEVYNIQRLNIQDGFNYYELNN